MNILIWLLVILAASVLGYINRVAIGYNLGWILRNIIIPAWTWIRECMFYFFCAIVSSLVATAAGMIYGIPWLIGTGTLIAFLLFMFVWTPVGIALRAFRVTEQVYPQNLGTAILFALTFSLFGIYYPQYISRWEFFIPAFLLTFIVLSFSWSLGKSYKICNWIILFVVLGMTSLVVFQFALPDLHHAIGRYLMSYEKAVISRFHRSSLDHQADALATYAIVREDSVLYDNNNSATTKSVKIGQTVLVVKIKEDLPSEEKDDLTEPLVKIVLRDAHGNFANPKGVIYKVPRSKLGKFMVASDIYDNPYIKLPVVITLTKKGEFGGTLPFPEDVTVMITVSNNSSTLIFPNGGRVGLPVGSQPYTVKKGDKLLFIGDGDYESIITVSN
ncbi:MAG: hypothetical protein Q8O93_01895 [bacterium]|nr:hypothetical protein [bacterium]